MDSESPAVSRRTALKRVGAGAAVAWTAPVILSMNTGAFAASPATNACSFAVTQGQTISFSQLLTNGCDDLALGFRLGVTDVELGRDPGSCSATPYPDQSFPAPFGGTVVVYLRDRDAGGCDFVFDSNNPVHALCEGGRASSTVYFTDGYFCQSPPDVSHPQGPPTSSDFNGRITVSIS